MIEARASPHQPWIGVDNFSVVTNDVFSMDTEIFGMDKTLFE
jgi:hypothetical protein